MSGLLWHLITLTWWPRLFSHLLSAAESLFWNSFGNVIFLLHDITYPIKSKASSMTFDFSKNATFKNVSFILFSFFTSSWQVLPVNAGSSGQSLPHHTRQSIILWIWKCLALCLQTVAFFRFYILLVLFLKCYLGSVSSTIPFLERI